MYIIPMTENQNKYEDGMYIQPYDRRSHTGDIL